MIANLSRNQPRLTLGRVVATPGVLDALSHNDIRSGLRRHHGGDWGDVCEDDQQENDFSFGRKLRVFSAYHSSDGVKFWIITEADRSATTILLPSEY